MICFPILKNKFKNKIKKHYLANSTIEISIDDITTDSFVKDASSDVVMLQSSKFFPRISNMIYHCIFLPYAREWSEFLIKFTQMPEPEKWLLDNIIKDTINFDYNICENIHIRVSYTKQSSSYDENYTLEIIEDNVINIRIVFLDSWNEIHKLIALMLYIVESDEDKRKYDMICKVMSIYPKR